MLCRESLLDQYGFNLCWIDISSSVIIIIAVIFVLAISFSTFKRIDEEEMLLLPEGTISVAYESQTSSFSVLVRSLSVLILIGCLAEIVLGLFGAFNAISPISREWATTHLVSSSLSFLSYMITTVMLFFLATKDVSVYLQRRGILNAGLSMNLQRFWTITFLIEVLRAYHWIIQTFMGSKVGKAEVAVASIIVSRVLILGVLVITALSFHRAINTIHEGGRSETSWMQVVRKLSKLMPFLWPRGAKLQLLVCTCFALLALGRVVNVLVPYSYKILVEDLSAAEKDHVNVHPLAWLPIIAYTFFRFLQGGVGLLSSLQYFLWIPVAQYTTREICIKMLGHLHSLSLQFHIKSKTGEILRVMDRGTSSIGSLLQYLAFNILPVLVDIGFAVVYFVWAFDATIALIVFVTMVFYIFFTVWITEWRTKFRREMNDLDAKARGRAVDSLLNFETVKYFGNEDWEVKEYDEAIREYQVADWKSSSSLNLLNTAQNVVITMGLFFGLIITGQRVIDHQLTVGDFVSFVTYLLQLYQPLNWFGTYYRVIQQNFIDMEKMLDLFEENEAISDCDGAVPFQLKSGSIKFDNVFFSYDGVTPILKGVSFEVPAGKTYALVGLSGGGKSSILRLLFRFYECQSGSIFIDDQDITKVTQKSLRKYIGVVPQDTVLFNDTIKFNIRYGNTDATDMEIERAARAAQIHERIMTFPDKYNTKVGERGLRLSGGEKQRVAMVSQFNKARTLLKNPAIILLDEATSSLDNQTEMVIQNTLDKIFAHRTRLVVAHRLTTIVNADMILVINDGQIIEQGTHDDLLESEGEYFRIWHRQNAMQEENSGSAHTEQ